MQLYDAYEYAKQHNVDVVNYGYNWTKRNILSKQELYALLSQPTCDDYVAACGDNLSQVINQLNIIKNDLIKE